MDYKTAFNHGDKAWVAYGDHLRELTVGSIRIEHTKSKGVSGKTMFDNYRPQESYRETYMMEETGIGSGNVYTLGETVFKSQVEAQLAIDKKK